jgi:electron transport complex protein RnfE
MAYSMLLQDPMMNSPDIRAHEYSWVLLAVLAVCPFVAMSDTVIDAIGISIAMLVVVTASSLLLTVVGTFIPQNVRWIAAVLITSASAAAVALAFDAWVHPMHDRLNVFLAMLVCNPVLMFDLGFEGSIGPRLITRSIMRALFASWILIGLSIGRELVGRGSLLHDANALFGSNHPIELIAFRSDMGFLLAMLAPGAFFAIGIAFALYQRITLARNE